MVEELRPIRERAMELRSHPEYVVEVLAAGAEHCRSIAVDTMREVRRRMGMIPAAEFVNANRD
jgi:tryptophanyl-tRNA synthetase